MYKLKVINKIAGSKSMGNDINPVITVEYPLI
jgi:hypothetical protein